MSALLNEAARLAELVTAGRIDGTVAEQWFWAYVEANGAAPTRSPDTQMGWAVVELMGHRRLAGFLTEQEEAGKKFLRLDVPGPDGPTVATQLYNPDAAYCITPTSEATAREVAASVRVAPVERWQLPAAPPADSGVDLWEPV